MGLLVKTPPVSVRRRSSNQDDEKFERNRTTSQPTIDRSLLDRDTLNFLVCQVRHHHEKFPIAEKHRGRSKKRWRKIEKQRRRSQIRSQIKHNQGSTRSVGEISGSENDRVLSGMGNKQDNDIVTMGRAFECIARANHSFNGNDVSDDDTEEYFSCDDRDEDEDHNERNKKESNKDSHFGRLSMFSRGKSSSRSSHSSSSSTFSKIIGKLGQSRWASIASSSRDTGSDEKKDADCRDEENEGYHRRSFEDATVVYDDSSSIFDFDDEDNEVDNGKDPIDDDVKREEIQGTLQDSVRDNEVDAIFEIRLKIEDEEVDPIFVSGLDDDSLWSISKSGSGIFQVHSGSLFDDVSDDDESVADSEIGDEYVSGCQGIGDAVDNDKSKDDSVSCSVIEFLEDREEDAIDILGGDIAAGEVSNINETTMTRPSHTSRKPDPLWVRNQDRRNELAWIRCAARNRERPMDFPIARKRRRQLVERKEESPIADMCDTWIFSCGDVFDV